MCARVSESVRVCWLAYCDGSQGWYSHGRIYQATELYEEGNYVSPKLHNDFSGGNGKEGKLITEGIKPREVFNTGLSNRSAGTNEQLLFLGLSFMFLLLFPLPSIFMYAQICLKLAINF